MIFRVQTSYLLIFSLTCLLLAFAGLSSLFGTIGTSTLSRPVQGILGTLLILISLAMFLYAFTQRIKVTEDSFITYILFNLPLHSNKNSMIVSIAETRHLVVFRQVSLKYFKNGTERLVRFLPLCNQEEFIRLLGRKDA